MLVFSLVGWLLLYLIQMAGLTVQNFLSAGVGILVAVALIRGPCRAAGRAWATSGATPRAPLDAPIARQSEVALRLQEAIEQRGARFRIGVDARIHCGRTQRHALREAITCEPFDRL